MAEGVIKHVSEVRTLWVDLPFEHQHQRVSANHVAQCSHWSCPASVVALKLPFIVVSPPAKVAQRAATETLLH